MLTIASGDGVATLIVCFLPLCQMSFATLYVALCHRPEALFVAEIFYSVSSFALRQFSDNRVLSFPKPLTYGRPVSVRVSYTPVSLSEAMARVTVGCLSYPPS